MKNDDSEKQKIAESFLACLRTRDWAGLESLLAESAVWSLPGQSVISGEAYGPAAIVHRAQTIVSYGINFELKHILIGQHGVALSLHNTARRKDAVLDEHLATVMTLRNGKIAAIDTYLSDLRALNTFFTEPKIGPALATRL